jgi:CrcB protein
LSALTFVAIFTGAGIGACLRWWLGETLNPLFPTIPMGTLAANLIGGLLIGIAVSFFLNTTGIAPEWRMFIVTGFLGGLTTFSTFSAEVVSLLARAEYLWALAAIGAHLAGSLAMTAVGLVATNALLVRH